MLSSHWKAPHVPATTHLRNDVRVESGEWRVERANTMGVQGTKN